MDHIATDDDDLDLLFSDWAPRVAGPPSTGQEMLHWSPVMDGGLDFHELMDLISNDEPFVPPDIDIDPDLCNSSSSMGVTGDIDRELCCLSSMDMVVAEHADQENMEMDSSKGVRLFHLLMAAAEAIGGASTTRELAKVILARLKEMVNLNNGTNMERLASHFTDGLSNLVERTSCRHTSKPTRTIHPDDQNHHPANTLAAFQLLQDMTPYVNFGYFTANQAILEAGRHERRVHVVDYDVCEGVQWASLIQAMVSRSNGASVQHLRITAISRPSCTGRKVSPRVHDVGRRLSAFAESVGQPFSFHICKLDADETFHPSALKLVRGEVLIINCMLHLPRPNIQTTESVISFVSGARSLNPRLVTVVEEEAGVDLDGGFGDRILEALHHYSAMYESLEVAPAASSKVRGFVDQAFLGPWISGSVARVARGGQEGGPSSLGEWIGTNGFTPVEMSFANQCQAKLLLGLFGDGYTVELAGNRNRLVLGWKSRPLASASVWTCAEPHS